MAVEGLEEEGFSWIGRIWWMTRIVPRSGAAEQGRMALPADQFIYQLCSQNYSEIQENT